MADDPTPPVTADPGPTVDSAGPPSTTAPTTFQTIPNLQVATTINAGDLIWLEQYNPGLGRYESKQIAYEAFRRLTHPDATYVTANRAAIMADCGFAGDGSAGPFVVTLLPIAQMGCREIPILNVGTTGSFTVEGQPGEPIIGPAGSAAQLSFGPGETARLRAVSVPAPSLSGWYLVGV